LHSLLFPCLSGRIHYYGFKCIVANLIALVLFKFGLGLMHSRDYNLLVQVKIKFTQQHLVWTVVMPCGVVVGCLFAASNLRVAQPSEVLVSYHDTMQCHIPFCTTIPHCLNLNLNLILLTMFKSHKLSLPVSCLFKIVHVYVTHPIHSFNHHCCESLVSHIK